MRTRTFRARAAEPLVGLRSAMVTAQAQIDLVARLARVRDQIANTTLRFGRPFDSVTLVAVTKTQPVVLVEAAAEAGVSDVGENRVQDADEKIAQLSTSARVTWHMIGTLQKNKVHRALALFDVIHSIDSIDLAQEVSAKADMERPTTILLQVNVAREPSKHGFDPTN